MELMDRAPKIIGVFALFVWGHGIFNLWPLPPKSDLLPLELEWSIWQQTLLFTVFGLLASAVAYRAVRFWWLGILITSGIILLINVPPLVANIHDSPSFSHWLNVWLTVFGRFRDEGKSLVVVQSIYSLLVYPLYHLVLVTGTLSYLIFQFRKSRRVRPTAA